jgi:hypothetical protein
MPPEKREEFIEETKNIISGHSENHNPIYLRETGKIWDVTSLRQ